MVNLLGRFSLGKFSRALVQIHIKAKIEEICRNLGPARVDVAITKGLPIKVLIPLALKDTLLSLVERGYLSPQEAVDPEQVEAYFKQQARPYSWVAQAVTDQELRSMVTPDCMEVVRHHGPKGEEWLQNLLNYVRSYFKES